MIKEKIKKIYFELYLNFISLFNSKHVDEEFLPFYFSCFFILILSFGVLDVLLLFVLIFDMEIVIVASRIKLTLFLICASFLNAFLIKKSSYGKYMISESKKISHENNDLHWNYFSILFSVVFIMFAFLLILVANK